MPGIAHRVETQVVDEHEDHVAALRRRVRPPPLEPRPSALERAPAPRRDGERRRARRAWPGAQPVCPHDGVQQDVDAVCDVLGLGELSRRVADPAHARHEDHRHRRDLRHLLRVVARPTAHALARAGRARPRARPIDPSDAANRPSPARCSRPCVTRERRAGRAADFCRSCRRRASKRSSVAASRSRRSTVSSTRPGMTLRVLGEATRRPTVATCRPGSRADGVVDGHREPRGGQHRVLALVHRRGSGVVGEAVDGHVEPAQADDAGHRADAEARALEQPALLDVELEVAVHAAARPHGLGQPRDGAAHEADALAERLARARDRVEVRSPRTPTASLLPIVPPSSFCQTTTSSGWRSRTPCSRSDRATSMAPKLPTGPSKLPPSVTESTCEPMRIGGSAGSRAVEPPDDVAGRIDTRVETGLAKQPEGELAPGQVRVGIGDPVDAARRFGRSRPTASASRSRARRWP